MQYILNKEYEHQYKTILFQCYPCHKWIHLEICTKKKEEPIASIIIKKQVQFVENLCKQGYKNVHKGECAIYFIKLGAASFKLKGAISECPIFFYFCFPSSLGALFVSTTNFKLTMNFLHQFIWIRYMYTGVIYIVIWGTRSVRRTIKLWKIYFIMSSCYSTICLLILSLIVYSG